MNCVLLRVEGIERIRFTPSYTHTTRSRQKREPRKAWIDFSLSSPLLLNEGWIAISDNASSGGTVSVGPPVVYSAGSWQFSHMAWPVPLHAVFYVYICEPEREREGRDWMANPKHFRQSPQPLWHKCGVHCVQKKHTYIVYGKHESSHGFGGKIFLLHQQ